MWMALVGTVGFGALLVVGALWCVMRGMRALEDDDAGSPDMRADKARRPVATHRERRDDGAMRAVWQDEYRSELRRRRDAATKARGPARLQSGGVPPAA